MSQPTTVGKRRNSKDGLHRILLAARYEFCRSGLAGARLDAIAQEAAVSKQLIHHYFRTKTELYVAMVDDVTADAIEQLSQPVYEAHPPDEAIRLFLYTVFDLFIRWPFMAGLFNDQGLYGGEHIPEHCDFIARAPALKQRLQQIFQQGQRTGIFKRDLDTDAVFGAGIMLTLGGFTSGKIVSSFLAVDFSRPEKLEFWRTFSADFVLAALRP